MERVVLVFVPTPGIGHLVSTIELANHLVRRDRRFSITVLVMKAPNLPSVEAYIESLATSLTGVRFIYLPQSSTEPVNTPGNFISVFIESQKPHVKDAITNLLSSESSSDSVRVRLAGLVVDMFCTSMTDVANELGIPTFIYFTSGASLLGLTLHLPTLDKQITTDLKDVQTELRIPSFTNPVSPLVFPSVMLKRDALYETFVNLGRKYKEVKGIIINTFFELEPYAVDSFADGETEVPPVYPVGPLLDLKGQAHYGSNQVRHDEIMKWLDDQPPSSVVFLCFGSGGSFGAPQVKEMALGLERSGYRFVWSLRQPPKGESKMTTDYTNPADVLPEGFLDRTEGKGLVCGWVPQVAILGHEAIGGFVSHCGWNSTLESLWYGVPILTWPLYAEQQLNAFVMAKELGLAVEMRLDYRIDGGELVMAEEVERGVRSLMDGDNEVRRKVKEMGEMSKKVLLDGGSSFNALGQLIEELMEKDSRIQRENRAQIKCC